MVGGFYAYLMPVTEYPLVFTIYFYNRNYNVITVKIEIFQIILFPEGFSPVFKITDEMPVPYDA